MEMQAIADQLGLTVVQVFGEPPDFRAPRMAEAMEHLRLSPESIAEVATVIRWVDVQEEKRE
jgi:hypothetical protein